MNTATGSPLQARQNPLIYLVIVYLLIAIGVLLLIAFIVKIIQKRHASEQYIEYKKNKATTYKDVTELARKIHLSKQERQLLWRICRNSKAKNIFYNYTDEPFLDEIFKKEYVHMVKSRAKPALMYELFRLRFHLYKTAFIAHAISSSFSIPAETVLTLPTPDGTDYQFTLVKNAKNGLYLSIPEPLANNQQALPKNLSKIALVFTLKNGQQYAMSSRVIQYLTLPDGVRTVLITHCHTLCFQSRRSSKRFAVNRDCVFSAVEISTGKKGEKKFKPKENTYKGVIANISEGGCKLYSNLPIKPKQFISLNFEIMQKQEQILGQIVNTRSGNQKGVAEIHIMFKNVPTEIKVRLLAELYEYIS